MLDAAKSLTAQPGAILMDLEPSKDNAMKRVSVACMVSEAARKIHDYGQPAKTIDGAIAYNCNQFRCIDKQTEQAVLDYFEWHLGDLMASPSNLYRNDLMLQIQGAAKADEARARAEFAEAAQ